MDLKTTISNQKCNESDYFLRMFTPDSLMLASAYHREERRQLYDALGDTENLAHKSMVTIGAGPLAYCDLGLRLCRNYIAVDPHSYAHLTGELKEWILLEKRISIVSEGYENFIAQKSPGDRIYLFPFNVISYLDDPEEKLLGNLTSGDVVFIATWAGSEQARKVREAYLRSFSYPHERSTEKPIYDLESCASVLRSRGLKVALMPGAVCHSLIAKVTDS
jgi:hypothetical protein